MEWRWFSSARGPCLRLLLAIVLLSALGALFSCAGVPAGFLGPSTPGPGNTPTPTSPAAPLPPAPAPPPLPAPAPVPPPAPASPPQVTIATTTLPAGISGEPYSATITAQGGVAPYAWSIASGALPSGLALSAASGVISGTPTQTGSFGFTAMVADADSQTQSAKFSISISAAPQPLVILTAKLAAGTTNVPYAAALLASGGLTPYTWSIGSGALPAGLKLDSATGQIGGTPTAAGSFNFTAQVTDSLAQTNSAALSLTVAAPPALAILTSGLPNGTSGVAYAAGLSAGGGITPYAWQITAGSLPTGLTLKPSGEIGGAPLTPGAFSFTAQVTDSAAQSKSAALSITVNAPPPLALVTSSLPAGTTGLSYSAALSASGGVTPFTWTMAAGALPAGLALNSSGAISGTPITAGTFDFTVQVNDSAGQIKTAPLSITISPPPALTVLTTLLPSGTSGTAYSATLSASGGVTPYGWSIAAGALPGGLSLSTAGAISGTPKTAGGFNFTAQVTDAAAQIKTAALNITINPAPALNLLTASLPSGTTGVTYSATLSASGGVTPYSWSISGALAGGLNLNASTGVISGTPTASGTFNFTVQVTDSAAQTKSAALSIAINPAPALSLLTTSLPPGTTGTSYSASLSAGGGVTPYTWTITAGALPAGLSLNSSSGEISGTPAAAGSFNFTAQVADSASQTKSAALSISISVPPLAITSASLPGGNVGTSYSATLTASGGVTPYTWSISAGSLPAGLSLGASSGAISGTPTAAGTSDFTVQVADSASHTQSAALSITIHPPPSDKITHVVVIMEENKSYGEVIGNDADMPYLNSLASTYGLAANYYANVLSSQGDYFMITMGEILTSNSSFTGVTSDDNIVRHLVNAGISWKAYAESIPHSGYLGDNAFPYMKIHNAFAYFSDVVNDSSQANNIVPFSQFASDLSSGNLPAYSFVIPNAYDDGHSCPPGNSNCGLSGEMALTDQWLQDNIAPLLSNSDFKQHGLLIITWDESDGSSSNGGGHVATVIAGAKVKPGYVSTTFYQHQSALKLSMQALGLTSFPNAAASAPSMTEFFSSPIP